MVQGLCYNDLSWTRDEGVCRNPFSLWYNGFPKRRKSLLSLLNLNGIKSHILHSDFADDSSADRLHKIERDQCIFLRNVDVDEICYYHLDSTFRITIDRLRNYQCVQCVLVESVPIDKYPIRMHYLYIAIG